MSLKISEFICRVAEHPRGFLTPRNLVIAACVGVIARLAITKVVEMVIDFVDSRRNTPNLRVTFRKPYEPDLLKTMDHILTNAMTDISFFGWRYIAVEGYRGRISMDEVAERIEWLSKHEANIAPEDLAIGQTFADKILDLYEQGDRKNSDNNSFTGIICAFRDRQFDLFGVQLYGSHKWDGLTVFKRGN